MPSFHWSPASSPTIGGDPEHAVRPLIARTAVCICGASRTSRLAGLEASGPLEAAKADGGGQAGRASGGLDERCHDVEVERTGVHLTDVGEGGVEAEVAGHCRLELDDPVGAAQQVEHVLLGADGPLDAPKRVPREELLDALERLQELLAGVREALAIVVAWGGVVASPG